MEEILNSTKHACDLAQYVGPKLANMANQPNMLLMSIDEVVKAFGVAKERLLMMSLQDLNIKPSSFASMLPHGETHISATSGSSKQKQFMLENKSMVSGGGGGDVQELRYRGNLKIGEMGVKDVEGSDRSQVTEEKRGMEASPSPPRKRSRKNDPKKRTILFPAHDPMKITILVPAQVGNTQMPPEDGFTWSESGQKRSLGTKYPRACYRCNNQNACPARKQVQRLDNNPNIFEVTYSGEHTCSPMWSTAPSSFPPPQPLVDISKDNMTQTQSTNTISPQLPPSSTSDSAWLSLGNLSLHGDGGSGDGGRMGAST